MPEPEGHPYLGLEPMTPMPTPSIKLFRWVRLRFDETVAVLLPLGLGSRFITRGYVQPVL